MKKESSESGAISIRNLQRKIAFDRTALEQFALRALRLCRQQPGAGLTNRAEIGVLVVSDRKIADLHRRFMKIAGPTDVITFQHGEIFISAETAQRQAAASSTSCAFISCTASSIFTASTITIQPPAAAWTRSRKESLGWRRPTNPKSGRWSSSAIPGGRCNAVCISLQTGQICRMRVVPPARLPALLHPLRVLSFSLCFGSLASLIYGGW